MSYNDVKNDTLDNLRAHDVHREHMKASTFPYGGWHFTNIGGVEFIKRKLQSYSHQEFNNQHILDDLENKIRENKDFIGRDFTFRIDESGWPQYLQEHKKEYSQLCLRTVRQLEKSG